MTDSEASSDPEDAEYFPEGQQLGGSGGGGGILGLGIPFEAHYSPARMLYA